LNSTLTNCHFPISDFQETRKKVLNYAKEFSTFCFLDNNGYQLAPHVHECLLAAGVKRQVTASAGHALEDLERFLNEKRSWLFGHISYDLKNEIEDLTSSLDDGVGFPDLHFFEPEVLIRLSETEMIIEAEEPDAIYISIGKAAAGDQLQHSSYVDISQRFSKDEYLNVIEELKAHILRGDCYEINFCQEFYAEHASIDPFALFLDLNRISPNPFSALYRLNDKWLICASPERWLSRHGNHILSQPMKGTISRVAEDKNGDERQRQLLVASEKDRAENVMVVDLVRNDLAKVCKEGTVVAEELFGVYPFPQVYQMVSTIGGELEENISFTDILRATFPMGSMTGAPKKRVMELIEQYERSARGIFSGAVGYIDPAGNFDFNVVIRSIMYNAAKQYLSFQVGSGITFKSDAQQEWEECLLKAGAIQKVLSGKRI
jgi:para-aminobenzoate synthetase component 1